MDLLAGLKVYRSAKRVDHCEIYTTSERIGDILAEPFKHQEILPLPQFVRINGPTGSCTSQGYPNNTGNIHEGNA